MKVWIVGAFGMLGSAFRRILKNAVATDSDVDITSEEKLFQFAQNKGFTHILNCAAYTKVDKAEEERDKAFSVNALGPKNLGKLASCLKCRVIHFSTDYVFDGERNSYIPKLTEKSARRLARKFSQFEDRKLVDIKSISTNLRSSNSEVLAPPTSRFFSQLGYREEDERLPCNVYGESKLEGEKLLLKEAPFATIIRTSWLFGLEGSNFVFKMTELMKKKQKLIVVDDQIGRPTFCDDLVEATLNLKDVSGIFHFANREVLSWYEFALAIYRETGLNGVEISPGEFLSPAKRPKNSVLDTRKYEKIGVIPSFEKGLRACVKLKMC